MSEKKSGTESPDESQASENPESYVPLDCIAQGDISQIWRTRFSSIDGSEKIIVLKVLPENSSAELHAMLLRESRVMMNFSHPNLPHIYEAGDDEDAQPFIAMEYVDGRNLSQILKAFGEHQRPFPVDFACYIIQQAALGLSHVHRCHDEASGDRLEVVHRAFSPGHLMVSLDASVKIIDFTLSLTRADAGGYTLQGQACYMSPEMIAGRELDGRSDLFSLGVVFWELLSGQSLFAGQTDLEVLKQIAACDTFVRPPSKLNPAVPKELDGIVCALLEKEPEKRIQTADALSLELEKFLQVYRPSFKPTDLAITIRQLFMDEIAEDQANLKVLLSEADLLVSKDTAKTDLH